MFIRPNFWKCRFWKKCTVSVECHFGYHKSCHLLVGGKCHKIIPNEHPKQIAKDLERINFPILMKEFDGSILSITPKGIYYNYIFPQRVYITIIDYPKECILQNKPNENLNQKTEGFGLTRTNIRWSFKINR